MDLDEHNDAALPASRSAGPARIRFVIAVGFFALICAACTSTVEPLGEPLDEETFVAEATRICEALSAEQAAIAEAGQDDSGFLSTEALADLNAASSEAFAELFALVPPIELQTRFDEMRRVREELTEAASARIPEPEVAQRLGPQWEAATTAIGLTACS